MAEKQKIRKKTFLQYFKQRFIPKSLLKRSLLIIVTPLLLFQFTTAYFFFNRHWETVSRRLATDLVGDITFIIQLKNHFNDDDINSTLFKTAKQRLLMEISFQKDQKLPQKTESIPTTVLVESLNEILKSNMSYPYTIGGSKDDKKINIFVQLNDGLLIITTPSKRFFSSTTYTFIGFMIIISILLFGIATIFMKNQIRPVYRLAQASENFGKGQDVSNFKLEGASEIRKASQAFILMKERIKRQISERVNMLAGVSHDLRTPITRMKLQLAMMSSNEEIKELLADVEEMETMIEGYLSFARGEGEEKAVKIQVEDIINNVVNKFKKTEKSFNLDINSSTTMVLRKNAFERCLTNIIANAVKYGNHNISVATFATKSNFKITIDDDGIGIPKEKYDEVFKAFSRIDNSRNKSTGGVGLGLSIAKDIITSHGGEISLDESPINGLRVLITLPI
ncbi:MAG: ATP-binding protein [Alphaproteobacteria bacterium]